MSGEREHDLARAASDWAWEADDTLRITRVCDRFTGATGRPASAVLGQGVDTLGSLSAELIEAFARRDALRGAPLVVDTGGTGKSFRLSGTPHFDSDGGFRGYSGTAVGGGAPQLPESRAAFLSNVGHEFRTPLNAIIGFAEVMDGELYGPLSDRYAGYARDIAQAGRHLLALIEDVLDSAASGDVGASLATVDVDAVIDRCLRIAAITAGARRVSIVREDSGLSYHLWADERRVAQILVNLLVNAIKFSPEGGQVSIAARRSGDAVEIEVSDDGPGIAPEDQIRIFGKFEQAGRDALSNRDGAGLGLAIARDFAVAMDGRLEVASIPGEGARFTLTLPAV